VNAQVDPRNADRSRETARTQRVSDLTESPSIGRMILRRDFAGGSSREVFG
jgi:hypothetical protein